VVIFLSAESYTHGTVLSLAACLLGVPACGNVSDAHGTVLVIAA
jgi:hypothetical protein